MLGRLDLVRDPKGRASKYVLKKGLSPARRKQLVTTEDCRRNTHPYNYGNLTKFCGGIWCSDYQERAMKISNRPIVYALFACIALSPMGVAPARAGGTDALIGAMAGVAVGAMIAGSMAHGDQGPRYRYHTRHAYARAPHYHAARHVSPTHTRAAGSSDPFAGASHAPAPVSTPARYQ